MADIDAAIDALRRGTLDIDCSQMVLEQDREGGRRFEGRGYIRQADDGTLIFKIYVATHNANIVNDINAMLGGNAGKLIKDEDFFNLDATAHDGTHWCAKRILPKTNWGNSAALVNGKMQSMTANLDMPLDGNYLRLHFFKEYDIPCNLWSKTEDRDGIRCVRDRAEFEACGAKFEARKYEGSGDTVLEATSDTTFPVGLDLRIQEALQYLIAEPAFWRARLQNCNQGVELELASPWRKSIPTQFPPPIASTSGLHFEHGWRLFSAYLQYVAERTSGTHWNPVAYHLYNACEATANSVDARAVSICVAVEAVASLIPHAGDEKREQELARYQERALAWLANQSDVPKHVVKRAEGQINSMKNKRPQDTLYALSAVGKVDKKYVSAWDYLRNRHIHPKLKDLEKPTSINFQKLIDHIHMVEVLLRQLTFHLIGYEGPFTDYGVHGTFAFPSKQYPLGGEDNPSAEGSPPS